MSKRHSQLTTEDGVHRPHDVQFKDETERDRYRPAEEDLHKWFYQEDLESFFALIGLAPPVWQQISYESDETQLESGSLIKVIDEKMVEIDLDLEQNKVVLWTMHLDNPEEQPVRLVLKLGERVVSSVMYGKSERIVGFEKLRESVDDVTLQVVGGPCSIEGLQFVVLE